MARMRGSHGTSQACSPQKSPHRAVNEVWLPLRPVAGAVDAAVEALTSERVDRRALMTVGDGQAKRKILASPVVVSAVVLILRPQFLEPFALQAV